VRYILIVERMNERDLGDQINTNWDVGWRVGITMRSEWWIRSHLT